MKENQENHFKVEYLEVELPWHHEKDSIKLVVMLFLYIIFTAAELSVGLFTQSLTLLADAFHMFSDQFSICITFFTNRISKRRKTREYSYGWIRAEIIGALINGVFLFSIAIFIFLEAISRFIEIPEVRKPLWIIIVGGSGLLMNLSGLAIFKGSSHIHSHSHSHGHGHAYHNEENNKEENKEKLNIHGIFLHILGDALGSIGAILSGLGIWFLPFGKYRFFVDPICSIFIACIILTTAIPLVRRCTKILMQSVPDYIDLNIIRQELLELDGVVDVHDLHIWQLADTKVIGTVHLTCPNNINFFNLATNMKKVMHSHGIHSTTFQPEFIDPRHMEETQQCTLICGEPEQCKESMCCDPLLGDEKQFLSKREKKKKTLPVELP